MLMALFMLACAPTPPGAMSAPAPLVDRVRPKISTGGIGFAVGSGYPGANVPFGLVKLSPDTADSGGNDMGNQRGGGYHADDVYIQGFSHMHLHGPGLVDFGNIALMPVDGMSAPQTQEAGYRSTFLAVEETASAGLYSVPLVAPAIHVDLTATEHTGLHRYRFSDEVQNPTVLVDLGHTLDNGVPLGGEVWLDPDTARWTGWMHYDGEMSQPFTVWFEAEFNQLPTDWGTWTDGVLDPQGTQAEGGELGAWFSFDAPEVVARVAISTVDAAGARANFEAEHTGFDFDLEAQRARHEWDKALGRFEVYGGSIEEQVIFATAVYHSLQMPTVYSDVDGRYRGFDDEIHDTNGRRYHSDMSMWDTYRTTHPLYTLAYPEAHRDILWSLSRMAQEGGAIPKWPVALGDGGFMVGSPGALAGAEAWDKGVRDWEEAAFFAVAADMARGRGTHDYGGRPDPTLIDEYGYYPADMVGTSVAWLQEVSLADHALSQLPAALITPEDAAHLGARSGAWRQVYNPERGFFQGKNADGSWTEWLGDGAWLDEYTEGNAWQYLWLVPHDPPGLWEAMGGEAVAAERLLWFFEQSRDHEDTLDSLPKTYYWHGNEIDIHAPFLFSYLGDRASSAEWSHWVLENRYGVGPDGIAGNDDGGTLSAWAVWAMMGVYPMAGTDQFALGEPVFDRVEVQVENGRFVVERLGTGPVDRVTLDGVEVGAVIDKNGVGPGHHLVFWGEDLVGPGPR